MRPSPAVLPAIALLLAACGAEEKPAPAKPAPAPVAAPAPQPVAGQIAAMPYGALQRCARAEIRLDEISRLLIERGQAGKTPDAKKIAALGFTLRESGDLDAAPFASGLEARTSGADYQLFRLNAVEEARAETRAQFDAAEAAKAPHIFIDGMRAEMESLLTCRREAAAIAR